MPIRQSELNKKHHIIFPHKKSKELFNSFEVIPTCDLVIAEVSYPSTSLGIELGWAHKGGIKIICIYKKDTHISQSLKTVSKEFIEYTDSENLVDLLVRLF